MGLYTVSVVSCCSSFLGRGLAAPCTRKSQIELTYGLVLAHVQKRGKILCKRRTPESVHPCVFRHASPRSLDFHGGEL